MNYELSEQQQADIKMQEYQLSVIAKNWQLKYNELDLKEFSDFSTSKIFTF
jgi:hypothetical protein